MSRGRKDVLEALSKLWAIVCRLALIGKCGSKKVTDVPNRVVGVPAIFDQCFGPAIRDFRFMVPMDYDHDTHLEIFAAKIKDLPTTTYFADVRKTKAANRLEAGKTYRVLFFPILGEVMSENCAAFLREQPGNILVGGQGVTLLQSIVPHEFPVGRYVASFGEDDMLWVDSATCSKISIVVRISDVCWDFHLGSPNSVFLSGGCLLCFCDQPSPDS